MYGGILFLRRRLLGRRRAANAGRRLHDFPWDEPLSARGPVARVEPESHNHVLVFPESLQLRQRHDLFTAHNWPTFDVGRVIDAVAALVTDACRDAGPRFLP